LTFRPRGWSLEQGVIRIVGLALCYPQRSIAPTTPLEFGLVPRSYGLLPTAYVAGGAGVFRDVVIGAVAEGEVVWLGFQSLRAGSPTLIRVRVEEPEPHDALTGSAWTDCSPDCLACPPDFALAGVRRGKFTEPFGRAKAGGGGIVQRLTILARSSTDRIDKISWRNSAAAPLLLMRPTVFADVVGSAPEPLDPDAAYKGWRLP
jgi:hypothetical protein